MRTSTDLLTFKDADGKDSRLQRAGAVIAVLALIYVPISTMAVSCRNQSLSHSSATRVPSLIEIT